MHILFELGKADHQFRLRFKGNYLRDAHTFEVCYLLHNAHVSFKYATGILDDWKLIPLFEILLQQNKCSIILINRFLWFWLMDWNIILVTLNKWKSVGLSVLQNSQKNNPIHSINYYIFWNSQMYTYQTDIKSIEIKLASHFFALKIQINATYNGDNCIFCFNMPLCIIWCCPNSHSHRALCKNKIVSVVLPYHGIICLQNYNILDSSVIKMVPMAKSRKDVIIQFSLFIIIYQLICKNTLLQ